MGEQSELSRELAIDIANLLGVDDDTKLESLMQYFSDRSIMTRGNYYHIKRDLSVKGRGRPRKTISINENSMSTEISSVRKRYKIVVKKECSFKMM